MGKNLTVVLTLTVLVLNFQNCTGARGFKVDDLGSSANSSQLQNTNSGSSGNTDTTPPRTETSPSTKLTLKSSSATSGFDILVDLEVSPAPTAPLAVTVQAQSDTALEGRDFSAFSKVVTVPKGQSKVQVPIKTLYRDLSSKIQFKVLAKADGATSVQDFATILASDGYARFKSVSAGRFYTCGVTAWDTVRCWPMTNYTVNVIEKNVEFGQLGGSFQKPYAFVDVAGTSGAVKIFSGHFHNCALMNTGSVKCWGANWSGQLGDGTTNFSTTAVTVQGLINPLDIRMNSNGSCALTQDRRVVCWGDFSLTDSASIRRISGTALYEINNFTSATGIVDTGSGFCIINSQRKLFCWASDQRTSQFGGASTAVKPTEVPNLTDLEDVIYLTSGLGTLHTNHQSRLYAPQFADGRASNQTHFFAPGWNLAVVGYTQESDGQLMVSYVNTPTKAAMDPLLPNQGLKNLRGLTSGQDHFCAWTNDFKVICYENVNYNGTGDTPVVVRQNP